MICQKLTVEICTEKHDVDRRNHRKSDRSDHRIQIIADCIMIRVEGNEHFVQIRGPQELYFEDELTRRNKTSKCTLKDFMKEAHQSWDSIDSDARTRFENQYKTLCQAANVLPNSTAAAYQNPKRARPAASKKRGRTAPPRFETNDFDSGTAVQVQEEDESWRECTVYRSKQTDGVVVLWFPETD